MKVKYNKIIINFNNFYNNKLNIIFKRISIFIYYMKIAIIDVNDLKYNECDMIHSNFSYQKISDILIDYITLKDVSDEDEMMQVIINEVANKNPDYPIHTATSRNMYTDLYLMCHISPSKEIYQEFKLQDVKYNGIASYLTDIGLRIYGKAVIFKINNDNNKLQTITLNEITEIFISKFIHKGIVVNTDDDITECKFIFNPVDWISPNEISKYKYYETEILGKVFMIFFDTTSIISNNIANKIYSGQTIKGRTIIGMRDQYSDMNDLEVRYEDLDKNTFQQLVKFCNDINQSRLLKNDEDIRIIDGKRIYNNFYKVLNNRVN